MMNRASRRDPRRGVLGDKFAFVLASSTMSGLGDGVVYVAQPLLVAGMTRDPAVIATISAVSAIPPLFGGLLAGTLVDRWPKLPVLFNAAMVQSALCAVFAVLMLGQQVNLYGLVAAEVLFAAAGMFSSPAFSAYLPMVVRSEALVKANAALSVGRAVTMQLVGLPLGGFLVTLSMGLPWFVDALSFVLEGLLLMAIGYAPDTTVPTGGPLMSKRGLRTLGTQMREGVPLLAHSPVHRARFGILATTQVALIMAETVMVLYAFQILLLTGTGFAMLLAVLAVGCLTGAAGAPFIRRRCGAGPAMIGGIFVMSCGMTLLGVFSSTSLSTIAIGAVGFGFTIWTIVSASMIQMITDDALQGRVAGAQSTILAALRPVASAFAGLLASLFGLHSPYLFAGLGLAVAGAVWLPSLTIQGK